MQTLVTSSYKALLNPATSVIMRVNVYSWGKPYTVH